MPPEVSTGSSGDPVGTYIPRNICRSSLMKLTMARGVWVKVAASRATRSKVASASTELRLSILSRCTRCWLAAR
jgi:hypothetical protein